MQLLEIQLIRKIARTLAYIYFIIYFYWLVKPFLCTVWITNKTIYKRPISWLFIFRSIWTSVSMVSEQFAFDQLFWYCNIRAIPHRSKTYLQNYDWETFSPARPRFRTALFIRLDDRSTPEQTQSNGLGYVEWYDDVCFNSFIRVTWRPPPEQTHAIPNVCICVCACVCVWKHTINFYSRLVFMSCNCVPSLGDIITAIIGTPAPVRVTFGYYSIYTTRV